MNDEAFTIPEDRLPEGFARRVDDPPAEPVPARPAATIVLLRPGRTGVEVLLLRRVRSAGFVPGAYVFPGGRVDADDAAPGLIERTTGLTPEAAEERLGAAGEGGPPAIAYYVAAVREAFEETGILVGRARGGGPPPSAAQDDGVRARQLELLRDEGRFPAILDALGCTMDLAAVAYVAHWITPTPEPRRYDTRFFAAAVPAGVEPCIHQAEMSEAIWIEPAEALRRSRAGALPMVFPTLKTLVALSGFRTPADVLADYRTRSIPTILPRLVRTPTGIGIEVPED